MRGNKKPTSSPCGACVTRITPRKASGTISRIWSRPHPKITSTSRHPSATTIALKDIGVTDCATVLAWKTAVAGAAGVLRALGLYPW